MLSILNRALSWAITSFGNKFCLKKEVKVDKSFSQKVLRQIYATRDRSIASTGVNFVFFLEYLLAVWWSCERETPSYSITIMFTIWFNTFLTIYQSINLEFFEHYWGHSRGSLPQTLDLGNRSPTTNAIKILVSVISGVFLPQEEWCKSPVKI